MLKPWWAKLLAGLVALIALLAVVIAFFPWDVLRGPVNRYVTNKTGRHFEITRKLDVKLGRTTRILLDGIEFANPDWAKDPYFVRAQGAEIDLRLLPLFHRRIEMPMVKLSKPELGLQIEADGRRSWALGKNTGDPANVPDIGALVIDEGSVHFIDTQHGADIQTSFAVEGPLSLPPARRAASAASDATPAQQQAVAQSNTPQAMPLTFNAKGTWQNEAFTAKGRTGNVLYLSAPLQNPFPMEVEAQAGATTLRARGAIASLATMDGSDAVFDLKGKNLADLYKLVGVVLPATPRYSVHGHITKRGELWSVKDINGALGNSDLSGELSFDKQQKVPHLVGNLRSKWLDFDDLAPVVGLPEQPKKPAPVQVAQAEPKKGLFGKKEKKEKAPRDPDRKVLPRTPLDLARLKSMNSEVTYVAAKVTNVPNLPLERMGMKVRLHNGLLNLDDVNLGVAGGTLAGKAVVDSHSNPARVELHLDARSLELSRLFKNEQLTKSSFGKIYGDIDLKARGNSVAQMLGNADGSMALLMGKGQISNLLLEIAGLDGAEILKFLMGGDRNVGVRCAATAFDVNRGLMKSRAFVLDTVDTVVYGDGQVNLATEQMDMYFRPYPKDMSILSLRSPLKLGGTLGAPTAGPDKGALGGRAGLALALGAINPLLALAATVETGPGKDANCGDILRDAASPEASARVEQLAKHQQQATSSMGGPGGKIKSLLGMNKPNEDGGVRPRRAEQPAQAGQAAQQKQVPAAAPDRPSGPGAPGAPGAPDVLYGR